MDNKICIHVYVHGDGTASVDINIPADMMEDQCVVKTEGNVNAQVCHSEKDLGYDEDYEAEEQEDDEDEGLLYDLD